MITILKFFICIFVLPPTVARTAAWALDDPELVFQIMGVFWFFIFPLFLVSAVVARIVTTVRAGDKISRSKKL